MKKQSRKFIDFLGPYDYRPGFIYIAILVFNLSSLRTYSFDYSFGIERIQFFFTGLLVYAITGIPLYLYLMISQAIWKARRKRLSVYLLEILLASLITLLTQLAAEKFIIPLIKTVDFLNVGVFVGELVTRFLFAILFVAITHNRLRLLGRELKTTSALNAELNTRYARLIESDEEIRSHASKLLHDRIQSRLMLAAAKLTRVSGVLSDEGKLGVLPVIKELEQIRAIDIREVSQLLSPNLIGEGLTGSLENLCREFENDVLFNLNISNEVEALENTFTLGIYRIVEQGVINSIKHGPASSIWINVKISNNKVLVIEVIDNGPGGDTDKYGTGSVIIDAWISILGGKKELESQAGKGFTLRVLVPQNKLINQRSQ
jgi:signal transduction histidine kinase